MAELKDILLGILVLLYGLMFYTLGRINFIEIVVRKLRDDIEESERKDD